MCEAKGLGKTWQFYGRKKKRLSSFFFVFFFLFFLYSKKKRVKKKYSPLSDRKGFFFQRPETRDSAGKEKLSVFDHKVREKRELLELKFFSFVSVWKYFSYYVISILHKFKVSVFITNKYLHYYLFNQSPPPPALLMNSNPNINLILQFYLSWFYELILKIKYYEFLIIES